MVGVTFQQIQKYENGQTTLNVIKLQQIAQALKVSVNDFYGDPSCSRYALLSKRISYYTPSGESRIVSLGAVF